MEFCYHPLVINQPKTLQPSDNNHPSRPPKMGKGKLPFLIFFEVTQNPNLPPRFLAFIVIWQGKLHPWYQPPNHHTILQKHHNNLNHFTLKIPTREWERKGKKERKRKGKERKLEALLGIQEERKECLMQPTRILYHNKLRRTARKSVRWKP